MRTEPKTIDPSALAIDALERMEDHRITSLFVCDDERRLAGIVHIHDLWSLQLSPGNGSNARTEGGRASDGAAEGEGTR
jgi:CBS-domain-containing membrane protein